MKKIIVLMFAVACALLLVGCDVTMNISVKDAEKLIVTDGSSGEAVEVTDKAVLDAIDNAITSLDYEMGGKVENDGFEYSVQWLDDKDDVVETVGIADEGYILIWRDRYYRVAADLCIDTEPMAALFE